MSPAWSRPTMWLARWRRRVRHLFGRARAEREMDDEMRLHLALEIEDRIRQGATPAEARRTALRDFGGVERFKEEGRDARGTRWLEDFVVDLRYAARKLRRSPGYTIVAVVTIALGIGATTAIFSVVNGVLLRSLPFEEPERLVRLYTIVENEGRTSRYLSPPNFMSVREGGRRVFTDASVFLTGDATWTGLGAPQRLTGGIVSAGFFELMGARPVLGRTFRPEENEPGNHRIAVLSHGLWQQGFGGDPSVVGRTITLNGSPFTIVGVMAPGFSFPSKSALWVPRPYGTRWSAATTDGRKGNRWIPVVARLRPGVSLDAARAELAILGRRLAVRFPESNTGIGFTAERLRDDIVGEARTPLLVLFGSVALVLLIACTNVVGLLLARGATRQAELAVRAALGASRRRLVRQLLTESGLLGVVGGVLGLAMAFLGTDALLAGRPVNLPRLDAVRVDGAALAFAFGLTLVAAMLVGLAPALQATRGGPAQGLRLGGRSGSADRAGTRLRGVLVASEIALAVVLLAGAGLLIRSFLALTAVDSGIRSERVLSFALEPSGGLSVYESGEEIRVFYDRLLDRVGGLPGVQRVGAVSRLPIARGPLGSRFSLEGAPPPRPGESEPSIGTLSVTPDYLRTMGVPLLRGRGITEDDRAGTLPVVVINQAAAERFFPGEDPIGERLVQFSYDPVEAAAGAFTIVGVVGDVRSYGPRNAPRPTAYFAHAQVPFEEMSVVVRAAGDPLALTRTIRTEVHALDPNVAVPQFTTLEQVMADSVSRPRFIAALLGLFAAVALALAAIGIFGLLSFAVAQQTREIGVRIALGARPGEVLRRVVARAVRLAVIGLALGLLGALALTRLLESVLFGVSATDPATYAGVAALLGATAVLASLVPARRAAAMDPMIALRSE